MGERVSGQMPALYIAHGGGPCFFMDWTMGPADTWDSTGDWLRQIGSTLGAVPQAVVVVSAHWEEPVVTVSSAVRPPLIYDYYGFPQHTYEIRYDSPGSPELAQEICDLLAADGVASGLNDARGFDHGVFIPLKLIFPDAAIPVVQVSLQQNLDPAMHLKIGEALRPIAQTQGIDRR